MLYVHVIGPVFVADWYTVNVCPNVDVEKTNGLELESKGVAPDDDAMLIGYDRMKIPW